MDETTQSVETPHRPLHGIIPFTRASRGLFMQHFEDEKACATWRAPVPTPLTDFGTTSRLKASPMQLALPRVEMKLSEDSCKTLEEAGSQTEAGSENNEKHEHIEEASRDPPRQKIRLKKPEDRKLVKAESFQDKKTSRMPGKARPQSLKRALETAKSTTALQKRDPISPAFKQQLPSPAKTPVQALSSHSLSVWKEKPASPQVNSPRRLDDLRRPAIQLRASGLKTALKRSSEPLEEDGFIPISAFSPKSMTSSTDWREVAEDTDIFPRKAVPVRSQKPDRIPKRY